MQFLMATSTNILCYNSQNKLVKNIRRDLYQQNPNSSTLLWVTCPLNSWEHVTVTGKGSSLYSASSYFIKLLQFISSFH